MRKNKGNLKLTIGLVILVLILPLAAYFYFTGGKGSYKLSLTRGSSKTIEESKTRGVFQHELDYRIYPDSIIFKKSPKFFIEKGFRYGEWTASDTESLLDKSNPYQIVCTDSNEMFNYDLFIEDYYYLETWRLNNIQDTIKFNLMTKNPPYDSICRVGKLILFKSINRNQ